MKDNRHDPLELDSQGICCWPFGWSILCFSGYYFTCVKYRGHQVGLEFSWPVKWPSSPRMLLEATFISSPRWILQHSGAGPQSCWLIFTSTLRRTTPSEAFTLTKLWSTVKNQNTIINWPAWTLESTGNGGMESVLGGLARSGLLRAGISWGSFWRCRGPGPTLKDSDLIVLGWSSARIQKPRVWGQGWRASSWVSLEHVPPWWDGPASQPEVLGCQPRLPLPYSELRASVTSAESAFTTLPGWLTFLFVLKYLVRLQSGLKVWAQLFFFHLRQTCLALCCPLGPDVNIHVSAADFFSLPEATLDYWVLTSLSFVLFLMGGNDKRPRWDVCC